ncbi:MAG: FAD-dependent oxidoreductase [Acidimicrobiales bacterium]|nr:FAD-dependent oxidoreductase [Acidimicrobiales bacterium]
MNLRTTMLDRIDGGTFDVLIIGGGINGAVASAVLAGRGASVAVVDRGDWASFTSQQSSNLVWGGFKYLENYELGLVRKLCKSRNRLMKAYPANIAEIGFLAALDDSSPFGVNLATLGSLGYWGIGSFKTKPPRRLSAEAIKAAEPVIDTTSVAGGIEYRDAILRDNDARFVFSFVRSAIDAGAAAANYLELEAAHRRVDRWHAELRDLETGRPLYCTAKAIINAAGPFVDGLNATWGTRTEHRIVYSKGIHLIVPQLTKNDRILAFFDDTQRLFYVIPMGTRSVIGTTDTRIDTPYTEADDDDIAFLLGQINDRLVLDQPLTPGDIIASRSGVRPLVVKNDGDDKLDVDWTSLSRKHEVETDRTNRVITVFGGKLTDCLNVGEEIADEIASLGIALQADRQEWYGEPDDATRKAFFRQARLMQLDKLRTRPDVEPLTNRLWRRYGRRAFPMLDAIQADPRMGDDIMDSADYLRVELHHAARTEMVTRLDDFLLRRSKISLVVPEADIRSSDGLAEVATILFGDQAEAKLIEHFGALPVSVPVSS